MSQVTPERIVVLLGIRHKLLTSKVIVLDASNGDLVIEQTFVDVLTMNIVCNR